MSTANTAATHKHKSVSYHTRDVIEDGGGGQKLTDDSKREIRPVQQRPLLVRTHHILAHMPQLSAARRGSHEGDAAKRQARQFRRSRRRFV